MTFFVNALATEIFGPKKSKQIVLILWAFHFKLRHYLLLLYYYQIKILKINWLLNPIFGLNGIIIFSSLLAYFLSQHVEIKIYTFLKQLTKNKWLWLRNNGSILCAQIIDTLVINYLVFYLELGFEKEEFLKVCFFVWVQNCF